MDISRRGLFGLGLGLGADLATGANVSRSALEAMADMALPAEAEAAPNAKLPSSQSLDMAIEKLTHDSVIYDLNRGLQKVKTGLSQSGYEEAYTHFRTIYDISSAKFDRTGDKFYLKAAILASFEAGNAMTNAASTNNGKFDENIRKAILSYENAMARRVSLGDGSYLIAKKGIINKAVPDERAINRGTARANEYLLERNDPSKVTKAQRASRQRDYDLIRKSLIKLHSRFLQIEPNERYHLNPLLKLMSLDEGNYNSYRARYDDICKRICAKQ